MSIKMGNYNLKYPIGEFIKPEIISNEILDQWITTIKKFPEELFSEVQNLTEKELGYKYRPNGWNIHQVVHHCADSHMNSFIRFKLALTEDNPTIRPYFEDRWAEQSDYLNSPVILSLNIIEGLHKRWVILIKSLTNDELNRTFIHPEGNKEITLKENIGIYAWHCTHHLEHIKLAKSNCY